MLTDDQKQMMEKFSGTRTLPPEQAQALREKAIADMLRQYEKDHDTGLDFLEYWEQGIKQSKRSLEPGAKRIPTEEQVDQFFKLFKKYLKQSGRE